MYLSSWCSPPSLGFLVSFALHATFTPKSDQIQSTSDFLVAAKAYADTEGDTMQWYAWKVHDIAEGPPTTLGIFTTFPNIIGRDAHLTGDILKTLDLKTEELLVAAPQIDSADVLAAKIAPTAGNESGLTVGAQVILCAKSRSVNRVKRALSLDAAQVPRGGQGRGGVYGVLVSVPEGPDDVWPLGGVP
ncbi:hypothetical protein OF83DRAFT_1100974 [Amylostereum chailletii]|nr:hypothetical protein OF83DRAFT_1100974 [Amylostereum chailletii]